MKAVIIGGVAAGMSAATKIKRTDPACEVVVYERGSFLSYGACGLPYFIGGVNPDPDLLIARPRAFFEERGIRTHLRHEVTGLDTAQRRLTVRDLDKQVDLTDDYDVLLIAVGCDSAVPPIPGADAPGVFYIKSMEDALLMEKIVTQEAVQSAVIIGGGYIGVEMAEAMWERGLSVTLIEAGERLLGPFEPAFSQMAKDELEKKGIKVLLGERVNVIENEGRRRVVKAAGGAYEADMVLMCVGVVPATGFLKDTGIQLARNGAVMVDREMRSSVDGVFAAGDCAVVYNRVSQEDFFLPLGTVANKCGRIAGGNMLGGRDKFIGALGTAAIKVCDLEMARTGLSTQDAIRGGLDWATNTITAYNHPSYYPGRQELTVQMIWEKGTRRLLGANVAGPYGSGAVHRANVLAVAIHAGLSTAELGMLDLAYAPPFSSVWDAVHIAANAAK